MLTPVSLLTPLGGWGPEGLGAFPTKVTPSTLSPDSLVSIRVRHLCHDLVLK